MGGYCLVLVLPDASHPLIHLYGEGETARDRDAIIEKYSLLVKSHVSGI